MLPKKKNIAFNALMDEELLYLIYEQLLLGRKADRDFKMDAYQHVAETMTEHSDGAYILTSQAMQNQCKHLKKNYTIVIRCSMPLNSGMIMRQSESSHQTMCGLLGSRGIQRRYRTRVPRLIMIAHYVFWEGCGNRTVFKICYYGSNSPVYRIGCCQFQPIAGRF